MIQKSSLKYKPYNLCVINESVNLRIAIYKTAKFTISKF
jgi:hypothetical protein